MSMPPLPQYVKDEREMIDAQNEGSLNGYDARTYVRGISPTGSPTGSPGITVSPAGKKRRVRDTSFDPSIVGGKRRTRKQKRSGKKSKTNKKRSGKKSKTSKKRGSRKRA